MISLQLLACIAFAPVHTFSKVSLVSKSSFMPYVVAWEIRAQICLEYSRKISDDKHTRNQVFPKSEPIDVVRIWSALSSITVCWTLLNTNNWIHSQISVFQLCFYFAYASRKFYWKLFSKWSGANNITQTNGLLKFLDTRLWGFKGSILVVKSSFIL